MLYPKALRVSWASLKKRLVLCAHMTTALIKWISGREENDCKIGSLSISTKVWDWPGIELATHNYFVHVTLRFQIRATHAYWSSKCDSNYTNTPFPPPPPPQTIAAPTHRHRHDIGAPHIDIQGDVRIIHGKPRWSPHSLKSIYNQPVRM